MLSSGHDIHILIRNSIQLHLPAMYLNKNEPVRSQALVVVGPKGPKSPPSNQ